MHDGCKLSEDSRCTKYNVLCEGTKHDKQDCIDWKLIDVLWWTENCFSDMCGRLSTIAIALGYDEDAQLQKQEEKFKKK